AAHINLAQNAWDSDGAHRVRNLLAQHEPNADETDLRGFEWHYLHRLSHAEVLTLLGHTFFATDVAYSPDGQRLASTSSDGTVRVWSAKTGQQILSLNDGKECVALEGRLKYGMRRPVESYSLSKAEAIWSRS